MIFVISGMILLLFVLVAIQYALSKKAQRQAFKYTLELLGIIKKIIGLTQRHRGLTATYLQGNQSVAKDIWAIRETIETLISQADVIPQSNSEPRWEAYVDHWRRLESASMTLVPPQSFKQHTSLIETLLYLLQDVAEHIEFADFNQRLQDTHFLWREFPQLVEYIGQARAIGVATATKGESTQIDKVKLGYLCEKINLMSETVFNKLDMVAQITQSQDLTQAKQDCHKLVTLINEKLITPNKVEIPSQEYFATASHTMDQCNAVLDNELGAIVKELS